MRLHRPVTPATVFCRSRDHTTTMRADVVGSAHVQTQAAKGKKKRPTETQFDLWHPA